MNKLLSLNALKHCNKTVSSVRSFNYLVKNIQPSSLYTRPASLSVITSNIHTSTFYFNSKPASEKTGDEIPQEKIVGTPQKYEFLAETKQLLDIVAKSLYSEKEVFVRFVFKS